GLRGKDRRDANRRLKCGYRWKGWFEPGGRSRRRWQNHGKSARGKLTSARVHGPKRLLQLFPQARRRHRNRAHGKQPSRPAYLACGVMTACRTTTARLSAVAASFFL